VSRRQLLSGAAAAGLAASIGVGPGRATAENTERPVLLTNLRYFDGTSKALREGRDILIKEGRVVAFPDTGNGPEQAEIVDCGGRAAIPGLIDAHWHAMLVGVSQLSAMTQDIGWVNLKAGREAEATLLRGFTTIRDTGGPVFGLKAAIDQGVIPGPRIFPSGATLSQTSGHGDFRLLNELPRIPGDPASYAELAGMTTIADGRDQVLRGAREQLMKGASQIKIMAGGGVSSLYDPLDTAQYTLDEIKAAVEAAADWGTYVCAHVYTPKAIMRCLEAGVRSIEHGQLADDKAIKAMAKADAWWSIQPFLNDADANPKTDPRSLAKQRQVAEGTVRAFEAGRAAGVNMAFGTDILFNPEGAATQGRQLAKLTRFMTPLEALKMATGDAGELLALSGERSPYRGPLGVIAKSALADILVVDGEPEAGLDFLANPDANLRLIMKGGRIVKNSLRRVA